MTNIEISHSKKRDTEQAFNEVSRELSKESKTIIFFASTIYSFDKLTNLFNESFPKAEVVGVTTVGEIHNNGIYENTLVAAGFSGANFKAKAVFVNDIHKYPILQRKELQDAAKEAGINLNSQRLDREGVALVFPNGLVNAEERLLSVVNSVFPKEGFHVFGGTAGDDAKFEHTFTSLNSQVSSTSGVVLFMKFDEDFKVYKESNFTAFTDKTLIATKVDVVNRRVYEFNGKKAAEAYASILGTTVGALQSKFKDHPLGFVSKQLSVASPMKVNDDGSITFYCQILMNAEMLVLTPKDILHTMDQTVESLNRDFISIEGIFTVNCILRKMQFQQMQIINEVNKRFSAMPNSFGFCSYGEQLNNEQINQTMVLLAIGKMK